jgi:hypothetical protein
MMRSLVRAESEDAIMDANPGVLDTEYPVVCSMVTDVIHLCIRP